MFKFNINLCTTLSFYTVKIIWQINYISSNERHSFIYLLLQTNWMPLCSSVFTRKLARRRTVIMRAMQSTYSEDQVSLNCYYIHSFVRCLEGFMTMPSRHACEEQTIKNYSQIIWGILHMQSCFLRRRRRESSWQNVQHVGNGIIVNSKIHPKKYLLNQILRGNLAFVFDKCLFSTHFFFSKSWNLNQVLGVDTLCWNLQLH